MKTKLKVKRGDKVKYLISGCFVTVEEFRVEVKDSFGDILTPAVITFRTTEIDPLSWDRVENFEIDGQPRREKFAPENFCLSCGMLKSQCDCWDPVNHIN